MKQIVQNLKTGDLKLVEVPTPNPDALKDAVQVRTAYSLISAGTEKMLIDLAQKSMVGKAQAKPDMVKQVLNKAKKEGIWNTYKNVMSKLESPMSLGYSAAGVVEESGKPDSDFRKGDRVAIAGAGYANHANINVVPNNLVAKIPDGVSFQEASYTTVASIAMQGVRLAQPAIGEYVAVIGLGLIGLITVQILRANGCRVIGCDLDADKVQKGLELGMDAGFTLSAAEPVQEVEQFTRGRLADHTIITASTSSNQPVQLAGEITRGKGDVIAVGAVGMDIPRDIYYKKELEVKVSMSYGPGRYDSSYEEGGIDYPYHYVRWTEQRNMESVLDLMAQGKLDVNALTSHTFSFDQALDAYELIQEGNEPYIGILLEYETEQPHAPVLHLNGQKVAPPKESLGVGFVGAGNYASLHLLPHMKKHNRVQLRGLVTAIGMNARQKADKFGFSYCATDIDELLADSDLDTIFIATRHSSHADYVLRALLAGKHVFVEKPLVVNGEQLDQVIDAYEDANQNSSVGLMVGLNRRFSPLTVQMKQNMQNAGPYHMMYRVNSGHIPTDAWLYDAAEGGGMLVGEMCHFVDMMQFVAGEVPVEAYAKALSLKNSNIADQDNVSISIRFDKGSVGTLNYNTIGDKAFPKERFEVYGGNAVAVIDDFKTFEYSHSGKTKRTKKWNQDKGQANEIERTIEEFRTTRRAPIPFEEIVNGMRVIFAVQKSLKTGMPVEVSAYELHTAL